MGGREAIMIRMLVVRMLDAKSALLILRAIPNAKENARALSLLASQRGNPDPCSGPCDARAFEMFGCFSTVTNSFLLGPANKSDC